MLIRIRQNDADPTGSDLDPHNEHDIMKKRSQETRTNFAQNSATVVPVGEAVEPNPLDIGRWSMVERGGVRVPGCGTAGRRGACCWSVYRGNTVFLLSVRDQNYVKTRLCETDAAI
jgi:hypothetical protein